MTLTVVTVVLLGGVNIFGGRGTIPGVVLGVLIVAVMQNALRLAHVTVEVQSIALGLLLILSVVIPTFAHQAKSAVDRVRRGRPPPTDAIARGEQAVVELDGGTALKHTISRADRRPRRSRGHRALGVLEHGCERRAASAAGLGAPRGAPRGGMTVGYLPKDIVNQYFAAAKTGVDKAATELGGTVTQVGPNEAKAGPADPVHHRPHDPEASARSSSRPTARTRSRPPSRRPWTRASRSSASTRARPSAPTTCSSTRSTSAASASTSPTGPASSSRLHGRHRDPVGGRDGHQPERLDRPHEDDPHRRIEVRGPQARRHRLRR